MRFPRRYANHIAAQATTTSIPPNEISRIIRADYFFGVGAASQSKSDGCPPGTRNAAAESEACFPSIPAFRTLTAKSFET